MAETFLFAVAAGLILGESYRERVPPIIAVLAYKGRYAINRPRLSIHRLHFSIRSDDDCSHVLTFESLNTYHQLFN